MSEEVEVLRNIKQRDYYLDKIDAIKQDIKQNESGIAGLYSSKAALVTGWATCLDELGDVQREMIASTIIHELKSMDCKHAYKHIYKILGPEYKRDYKQDLVGVGEEDEETKVSFDTFRPEEFSIPLPCEVISLETAPPEDLQKNEERIADVVKDWKRRWQEYINTMHERGIARAGQKESDVIGTPRPYDPSYGFFYQELVGLPLEGKKGGICEDLEALSKTIRDTASKIGEFPPATQKEDKELAEGIKPWRFLFQKLNEHMRPYADEKFSQSYVDWWATEALNRDFGKHAAAVKSKVVTVSGKLRGLTREQVGDKIPDLAEKALNFHGTLEIADKAFKLFQKDLPNWRRKRLDPSVGERKYNVGPKLSESAFGSGKDS